MLQFSDEQEGGSSMRLKRRLGAGAVMALIATLVVVPMPAGEPLSTT